MARGTQEPNARASAKPGIVEAPGSAGGRTPANGVPPNRDLGGLDLRWQCASCFALVLLAGRVGGKPMCGRCWIRLGYPAQDQPKKPAHEVERETHDLMTKRGGPDRHRVRAGQA